MSPLLTLLFALGLLALAALCGAGSWRRASPGQLGSVLAGLLVLAVALLALDRLAGGSLAWRMAQQLLLILVAAPLLVLGWPLPARALWHRLNRPAFIWVLTTALLWTWHVPAFYDAAARDGGLRALEQLSFLVLGALFWWAVLRPPGRSGFARGAAATVYLLAAALQSSLMGALLTFARAPLYPGYARRALAQGHDPLADQQLAGLLMWMPMDVVFVAFASVFFVRWLATEERRQLTRDSQRP